MKKSLVIFCSLLLAFSYANAFYGISTNKGSFNAIHECKSDKEPEKCNPGDLLISKNNKYYALIRSDGCLTVYEKISKKEKWKSCDNGQKVNDGCSPRSLVIGLNGIAVVQDCQKKELWKTSLKNPAKGPYFFKLTNKGQLQIYDEEGKKIWPFKKPVVKAEVKVAPEESDPNVVKVGQTIKIMHHTTGNYLHSHPERYDTGSRQQEVTALWNRDDNDWWVISKLNGNGALKHGDILLLKHLLTGNFLHSHGGIGSPATGQQEVTCYWHRDSNDYWRLEAHNGGYLRKGENFRLIHVNTNHALHSHNARTRVTRQQEVTGYAGRDANDFWKVMEISSPWTDPNVIKAGQKIKIQHINTGNFLHSHGPRYNTGSYQQEITALWVRDDNDWFFIRKKHGNGPIHDGDILHLQHWLTGNYLHSHGGIRSPATGQQEVTGFWHRDTNDDWRLEIPGAEKYLRRGQSFKLIHVNTNHALHSHHARTRVTGQQEVTAYAGRDSNDWWRVMQIG